MEDLVIYRAFGLAASPLTDLDRLNERELGHLLYLLNGTESKKLRCNRIAFEPLEIDPLGRLGPGNCGYSEFNARIACFDLSSGKRIRDVKMKQVARHLSRVERYLDVNIGEISAWIPSTEDIAAMAFHRHLQSADLVRNQLLSTEGEFEFEVILRPEAIRRQEKTILSTFTQLIEAMRDAQNHPPGSSHRDDQLKRATDEYLAQVERTLVAPLMEDTDKSKDVRIRALRAQLGHIVRMFHQGMPSVYQALSLVGRRLGTEQQLVPPDLLKQFQVFSDITCKLIREEINILKR
jgi:hypothetical protein